MSHPISIEPLALTPLDEDYLAVAAHCARLWSAWQLAQDEATAVAVRESLAGLPEQNRALALAMEPAPSRNRR